MHLSKSTRKDPSNAIQVDTRNQKTTPVSWHEEDCRTREVMKVAAQILAPVQGHLIVRKCMIIPVVEIETCVRIFSVMIFAF